MTDQDIYHALDAIKFSLEEKNSLYYNIRDIIATSSKEEASLHLVQFIENIFSSKIEEAKEQMEERKEGIFSSTLGGKAMFKRVT